MQVIKKSEFCQKVASCLQYVASCKLHVKGYHPINHNLQPASCILHPATCNLQPATRNLQQLKIILNSSLFTKFSIKNLRFSQERVILLLINLT